MHSKSINFIERDAPLEDTQNGATGTEVLMKCEFLDKERCNLDTTQLEKKLTQLEEHVSESMLLSVTLSLEDFFENLEKYKLQFNNGAVIYAAYVPIFRHNTFLPSDTAKDIFTHVMATLTSILSTSFGERNNTTEDEPYIVYPIIITGSHSVETGFVITSIAEITNGTTKDYIGKPEAKSTDGKETWSLVSPEDVATQRLRPRKIEKGQTPNLGAQTLTMNLTQHDLTHALQKTREALTNQLSKQSKRPYQQENYRY